MPRLNILGVKYVKRSRRFQKPGITHDFPDRIPPEKSSVVSPIDTSNKQALKGFLDGLVKEKTEASFKPLYDWFRAAPLNINKVASLLAGSSVSSNVSFRTPQGKKLKPAEMALRLLARPDNLEVMPNVKMMNDFLLEMAKEGKALQAFDLLNRLPKEYGVKANDESREIVACGYLVAGQDQQALRILQTLPSISKMGQFVTMRLIQNAIKSDDIALAWDIFDKLRAKTLPAPEICAIMLMSCGKFDMVEKAFLVYRELLNQGLQPNHWTHSSLIYTAAKRKEYYMHVFELFKEMEINGMPIDIRVVNNLLLACSKVADMSTALGLWGKLKDMPHLEPNHITITNLLWVLAAVETAVDKISLRPFHYDMNPEELRTTAHSIIDWATESDIEINNHVKTAYLAVMAMHKFVPDAEAIFKSIPASDKKATSCAFELMFKLYDTTLNFEATQALLERSKQEDIPIPPEGWRAAIRTAALTNHFDEAIENLKGMNAAGIKPTRDEIKALHLRLCEHEEWALHKQMSELSLPPTPNNKDNYVTWRKRSIALSKLLQDVYGKNAPQLATKIDKGIQPFGKKKGEPVADKNKADTHEQPLKTPTAGVKAEQEPTAPEVAGVSRDKTTKIKAQVEEVKGVMEENIKQATTRGENLDSLQTKVEDLEAGAGQFSKNTAKVKKNLWYKNMKMTICISVIALVILACLVGGLWFYLTKK